MDPVSGLTVLEKASVAALVESFSLLAPHDTLWDIRTAASSA